MLDIVRHCVDRYEQWVQLLCLRLQQRFCGSNSSSNSGSDSSSNSGDGDSSSGGSGDSASASAGGSEGDKRLFEILLPTLIFGAVVTPMACSVVACVLGGILAAVCGWSFRNGFYFVVSVLAGM